MSERRNDPRIGSMASGEEVIEAESGAVLSAHGLRKRYGAVTALDGADFSCLAGEVHAILGENGAGKSTLIKILGGTVRADTGAVYVAGELLRLGQPRAAAAAGITAVYQELSLVPDLNVAQNIFLQREPLRALRLIDRGALRRQTEDLFHELGLEGIDPMQRAGELSLARKQLVEIAKAAARRSRIIVLDEPTSALSEREVQWLLELMRRWRSEGRGVIFISHRFGEIKAIADRLSIYRNGARVAVYAQGAQTDERIITTMSGRPIDATYPPRHAPAPDAVRALEVRDLWQAQAVRGVSFSARVGEIVGIGGLAGQGQVEVFLSLFGALPHRGQILLRDRAVRLRRPTDAVRAGIGIALIPAERKTEGLLLGRSVRENMTLPALDLLSRWGIVDRRREAARVREAIDALRVVVPSIDGPVRQLSGGNQQKVVLGKWLLTGARVLLLYDVTRGVDVGTKAYIYQVIADSARSGATVLFYSSDTQEMAHICHRVLVMYEGRIVRSLEGDEIDESGIVGAAVTHTPASA